MELSMGASACGWRKKKRSDGDARSFADYFFWCTPAARLRKCCPGKKKRESISSPKNVGRLDGILTNCVHRRQHRPAYK